jgi:hypothetical protein
VAWENSQTRKLDRAHLGRSTTPPALRRYFLVSIRHLKHIVQNKYMKQNWNDQIISWRCGSEWSLGRWAILRNHGVMASVVIDLTKTPKIA